MDIKITGVSREILERALAQARDARIAIMGRMLEAIGEPRTELAGHAPRISTIQINPEYIGMVIGKGGETIRSLESEYEVQIDIEEDGTILVYATSGENGDAAIAAINALTKDPEVGDEFTGKVVKTTDFGAFVELKKGTDGLLHVSNVGPGRVNHIEDVIQRGDVLDVLVQEVDKARGRIGLKLIQKHENGGVVSPEELVERAKDAPPRAPREERPPRDRDRGGRGGGRRATNGPRGRREPPPWASHSPGSGPERGRSRGCRVPLGLPAGTSAGTLSDGRRRHRRLAVGDFIVAEASARSRRSRSRACSASSPPHRVSRRPRPADRAPEASSPAAATS